MKKLLSLALCLLPALFFAQNLEEMRREKPFRWSGSIGLNTDFYSITGSNPYRADRFAWRLTGNPTAYVYGLAVPLTFTAGRSTRDVRYPTYQQFGASPFYKWAKVHAGWRNMTFSPYTLAGHTFLGGGVELTPKKFRFAAMAGRFQRARLGGDGEEFFLPSFRRFGWGVKAGIGSEKTFVDLIYFRAKDDPNSLKAPDSLAITPGENTVAGLSSRIALGRRAFFTLDAAASAFTRDLGSEPVSVDSMKGAHYQLAAALLNPRFSTRANFAGKTGLNFIGKRGSLALGYERIDPEFATMGAYFFQNDLENWTAAPAFSFMKGKARFAGSIGLQRNNLLGNRSETSWRRIGTGNLSLNPTPKFGIDFNLSNYRMTQSATAFELTDSLKLAQQTTQASVAPRLTFFGKKAVSNLFLMVNYQFLDDENPLTEKFGDVRAATAILGWASSFLEKKTSLNASFNTYRIELAGIETLNFGLSAGVSQPFFEEDLTLGLNCSHSVQTLDGAPDGSITNLGLLANWKLGKKWAINLGGSWLRSSTTSRGHFSEWRGQVGAVCRLR